MTAIDRTPTDRRTCSPTTPGPGAGDTPGLPRTLIGLADDDRPQGDRRRLRGDGARVPGRSAGRWPGSSAPSWRSPACRSSTSATYNSIFTIHGSVMVFLFAVPFGFAPRQLPRAAADRRARHGVPPAQRALVLAVPVRRHARCCSASSPTAAPPASAGSPTRRCRDRPGSPGLGADLWIVAIILTGHVGHAQRGQHHHDRHR